MKIKSMCVILCILFLAACGDRVHPKLGEEGPADEEAPALDVSDIEDIDVTGAYSIPLMEFDSDPNEAHNEVSTITTVMRNVYGSTDGEAWYVQAAIETASLKFNEDGTYNLYYKFINDSDQIVEIGRFSEGSQGGTYEIFGSVISFYPDNDTDPGFALADISTYFGIYDESDNLIITANTPSKKGEYLYKVKLME